MKYKIIALFGKAGAGKDYWLNRLINKYPDTLHKIIPSTTRPPRDYEINGKDYYFLTDEEFCNKVLSNSIIEATCFKDCLYGTDINNINQKKINIGVFNIFAIETLQNYDNITIYPILITTSDKVRLIRQLSREQEPNIMEIFRRYKADEMDFAYIDFTYTEFYNTSPQDIVINEHKFNNILDTLV